MRYENCVPTRASVRSAGSASHVNSTHTEVEQVNECPANLLTHTGNSVDDNLPCEDEDGVDEPCA